MAWDRMPVKLAGIAKVDLTLSGSGGQFNLRKDLARKTGKIYSAHKM